jgi:hypothetical protein
MPGARLGDAGKSPPKVDRSSARIWSQAHQILGDLSITRYLCGVTGIDGRRGFLLAVFRHRRSVRLTGRAARSEPSPRDVVFGRPVVVAILTDFCFLANILGHGFGSFEYGDLRNIEMVIAIRVGETLSEGSWRNSIRR